MNILMVGPNAASKGGIATVIGNFKEQYTGQHVFYLDTWEEKHKYQAGLKAFWTIRKKVKQHQIDIVHFHVAQKGSFFRKALLAKWVRKKSRVVFHMHASQFDTFYESASPRLKRWIRNTLDQLDGLVVLSDEWRAYYETITKTNITVIENAVPVPKAPSYHPNAKQIVTFGRIGQRKGSYDILQVAEQLGETFPQIEFVFYGDGEIAQVEAEIKQKQLRNVRLGGWVTDDMKADVMRDTLLHLLPSYQEGLPMAILETMAEGIPNLASNVGGIPQVLQDEQNGYMIQPADVSAMVAKLTAFLTDEKKREELSKAAFQTIQTNFSIDTYFTKWNEFYASLLKQEEVDYE
ncbi:glycosyltransferase family 4 protein [Listeria fleischmannii]|uniref:Glycosyltransferase family 4 protein n=2 Tax=Listeria fleischmannii TaxID=1069827 RepID=A0A841YHB3_9LIST|nr:glycosyltransferase family 4 protein [Listeria fleischmannii]MBC1399892.1 glycosyltransferase family 4 protein [Listeria fleischmannii]MBC1419430.1 glycosyltransferase family 4 protein [Listeria fleischmannii]MBC1428201.1 glycosyltransferase family 4 protein [Listeria fleischmannii]STY34564.1 GDP-mannose-dependent alpha-(1-2)-phosphatidylinositol mannosyltransferase [Listeria fleischmannii subsp. coloradonensis]